MSTPTQNPNLDTQFTLTEDSISVETVVSTEIVEFQSTQISKVTNEESGQNAQNFQNN